MSVRKNERKETEFKVLDDAKKIKEYFLGRMDDFPKRRMVIYGEPLINCVRLIYNEIRAANIIPLFDDICGEECYKERRMKQVNVKVQIGLLYGYLDDFYLAQFLTGDQITYIVSLIEELNSSLQNWMESDKKRYSQYLIENQKF